MPREQQELDPYAPPPRYKMKSGGMVRVALLAVMLGLGAWGVMEFNNSDAPPLVAEEQTEQVAENRADGGYNVTPTPDAATTAAPAAAPQAAPAAPASEPLPPPSTTIGGEAGR